MIGKPWVKYWSILVNNEQTWSILFIMVNDNNIHDKSLMAILHGSWLIMKLASNNGRIWSLILINDEACSTG